MTRGSKILIGAAVLAVVGAAAFVLYPRRTLPNDLLEGTPRDASALVELHVARLLESKAFDQLVSQRGHDKGMREVTEVCGDNPLAHVDDALIFVLPPKGVQAPDWGALLRGDLDPRALAECVKKSLAAHGKTSKLRQDDVGSVPCLLSSDGSSRACALWDGLLVGTDAAVRAALQTMAGEAESARSRPAVRALWDTLDPLADARGIALIPKSTKQLLEGLVRPFLPPQLAPVTRLVGAAGELFVGDGVRGELNLEAADKEDAETLAHEAQRVLAKMAGSVVLALTPARALIEQTKVTPIDNIVQFRGDYPLHALGTALDMLPAARQLLQGPAPASGAAAPPQPVPPTPPVAPAPPAAGDPDTAAGSAQKATDTP